MGPVWRTTLTTDATSSSAATTGNTVSTRVAVIPKTSPLSPQICPLFLFSTIRQVPIGLTQITLSRFGPGSRTRAIRPCSASCRCWMPFVSSRMCAPSSVGICTAIRRQ
uniref:CTD nuclear envelope phosphatase 1 n=1 Tax=Schistocephalus solidus TaxID=70667 RepID=A0A0X3Q460_SCHSO